MHVILRQCVSDYFTSSNECYSIHFVLPPHSLSHSLLAVQFPFISGMHLRLLLLIQIGTNYTLAHTRISYVIAHASAIARIWWKRARVSVSFNKYILYVYNILATSYSNSSSEHINTISRIRYHTLRYDTLSYVCL